MISLASRVHIFAHPSFKDKLTWCFGTVLGCGPAKSLPVPGVPQPMLVFNFPGGGSLIVEFSEDVLDESAAQRGAWLEIRTDDPPALKKKILQAGLTELEHPAHDFYFVAPGGQVLSVAGERGEH